jgi:hypothetical protein
MEGDAMLGELNTVALGRTMSRGILRSLIWTIGFLAAAAPFHSHAAPYAPVFASRFSYFNRVGSSITDHDLDLATCITRVRSMPVAASNIVGGVLGGVIDDLNRNAFARASLESCMVLRGWRVVEISKEEGSQLAALPPDALTEKLASMVGAVELHGTVLRTFTNVVLKQPNSLRVDWPYPSTTSLSEARFDWKSLGPSPAPASLPRQRRVKELKLGEYADGPGKALIVIRIVGGGPHTGQSLMFSKATSVGQADKLTLDTAYLRTPGPPGEGKTYVFSVDPGVWYLSSVAFASTCLEAPYVDVEAGDVVFFGSFTPDESLSVDLTPGPVAAVLPSELQAHMKVAAWKDGLHTTACGDLYAIGIRLAAH